MSEAEISQSALALLRNSFEIIPEVWGTHFSGQRFRIDAVLKPKQPLLWKDQGVALGVEFKNTIRFQSNFDTKDYTKWLAQCVDYAHTKWDSFGYLHVFAYGGLTDLLHGSRNPSDEVQLNNFVKRMMGQLGLGELKEVAGYGLTLLLKGDTHRIWSERVGVEQGKSWSLKRKFGSR